MVIGALENSASDAPKVFEEPPSNLILPHKLQLSIPVASMIQAQTVYRVMSVDKPLRPKETHVAFRIIPAITDSITLDILLHTSTVRQLRLSSNAIFDDITLILETMDAFSRNDEEFVNQRHTVEEQEFELNGVGRAG